MLADELNLKWHKEWRRQVVDAYCECRDVEVGEFVEMPLADWEALTKALLHAPSRTLLFIETVEQIMNEKRKQNGELRIFVDHRGALK